MFCMLVPAYDAGLLVLSTKAGVLVDQQLQVSFENSRTIPALTSINHFRLTWNSRWFMMDFSAG